MEEAIKGEKCNDIDKVSWFGYRSFIFTLVRALTISIGSYIMFTTSQVSTHISTIIGMVIALLLFGIFISISKNEQKLDIIDLNINLFGNIFGNVLNIILNVVFAFLGSLILYTISEYIDIQYVPNTSEIYIKLLIILPVVYAASKNISTISRISQVILFYNLSIFILSVIGLIPGFKFDNLLPIFDKDKISILYSAFIFAISAVAPIFLITIIPQNKVVKIKYKNSEMLISFILSLTVLIFIIITTIIILGIDIINIYRYPTFMALRQFSLFTIIERIERFLSLQFLMDVIIYLILTIYFISNSINKVLKQKLKILPYIVGIVILILSTIFFNNGIKVNEFIKKYYALILSFGIIFPMVITYLGIVLKKIKLKYT